MDKNTFIWRDLPLDAFNDGEQFLMLIPKSHRLSGKRGRTDGLASLSDGSSRTRFPFGPQYLMKDRCEADQHALRDIAVVAFAASMTRHLCSRETYHPFQRVNILRATQGNAACAPLPKHVPVNQTWRVRNTSDFHHMLQVRMTSKQKWQDGKVLRADLNGCMCPGYIHPARSLPSMQLLACLASILFTDCKEHPNVKSR